ncbi:hypothetical protein BLSTO_03838 [Blastocystis sp. subtype 1]
MGYWVWNTANEECSICQMPLDSCCEDCSIPGDSCPPVTGKCNHSCHAHCMQKWLQSHDTCPECRAKRHEASVVRKPITDGDHGDPGACG